MDFEQPCDLNVPKPNPYRSDRDLGDLDFRFDPKRGWFATDKEIASAELGGPVICPFLLSN